jgi:lipopolysaccharide transport system permease protein
MSKLVIDANSKKLDLGLKELYLYKDLLLVLALRDIKVRYAQTFIGIAWALVQPLVTLLIFMLVFGRAINVDTGSIPYPVFALAGMSAWNYFSVVMSQSGNSLISAQGMIKKVYFPRLVIPLSKVLVGLVDFGVTLLFLIGLIIYYQYFDFANLVYLPVFIFITIVAGLATGIWISALTIRFRDFQHVVPFVAQIGLYITPVAYPANLIPDHFKVMYYFNPMAGVIEGFRWSIIGGDPPQQLAYLSFVVIFLLFFSGLIYFKKVEKVMADLI